jgi:mannose-6-phosphate isomerase-like protein (cupin superfamily)
LRKSGILCKAQVKYGGGTHFQFRNMGETSLVFLIVTIPGWPGPEEAIEVEGKWPVAAGAS